MVTKKQVKYLPSIPKSDELEFEKMVYWVKPYKFGNKIDLYAFLQYNRHLSSQVKVVKVYKLKNIDL